MLPRICCKSCRQMRPTRKRHNCLKWYELNTTMIWSIPPWKWDTRTFLFRCLRWWKYAWNCRCCHHCPTQENDSLDHSMIFASGQASSLLSILLDLVKQTKQCCNGCCWWLQYCLVCRFRTVIRLSPHTGDRRCRLWDEEDLVDNMV